MSCDLLLLWYQVENIILLVFQTKKVSYLFGLNETTVKASINFGAKFSTLENPIGDFKIQKTYI